MRNTLISMISVLALSTTAALAEPLKGDAIRDSVGGRKVTLLTMGLKFPLFYNANGSVSGDGSAVGLSKYFNPQETGSWWVADDQLCQKFPTWYKGKTWCFELESAGKNRLNWRRDDGFAGKAIVSG